MNKDELWDAIVEPAKMGGWQFEPGLVDLMLRDVSSEPGALPLLSHALLATWIRRRKNTLTLSGYIEAGRVQGAIAKTAEDTYQSLTVDQQKLARSIFMNLTELGEGTQETRRRAYLSELEQTTGDGQSFEDVLNVLADARLVTTGENSVEVAHEALIREWPTLRLWLNEDRDALRLHRHLTESAREWQRRERDGSELYRGARLKETQEWAKGHSDQLSSLEGEFLRSSMKMENKERLLWIGVTCVGIALIYIIFFGITGGINRIIYQPVEMDDYWITIPEGEYLIGSSDDFPDEQPKHQIYLPTFQIGKYEVTNKQYNQCIHAQVCSGNPVDESRDSYPVVNVNWYAATTYCEWIGGRLPTEAEWEKAARGIGGNTYP